MTARSRIFLSVTAVAFLALLGGLLLDGRLAAADAAINAFLGPYRAEPLLTAFLWVTALGASPAVTAAAVTASALLWSERRLRPVAALWVAFLGAEATSWTVKFLVGRARPEFLAIASAHSPAFPSVHSTSAMAVYGFLAWLVARRRSAPRLSRAVLVAAAGLIVLIGFSRIFLSLHYTSDVLGGFLVGWFWLLAGIAVAEPPPARLRSG